MSGPPPSNLGINEEQPWDLPGANPAARGGRPVSPIYLPLPTQTCPQPKIFQAAEVIDLSWLSPDSTGPTTTTIHKFDQLLFVEPSPFTRSRTGPVLLVPRPRRTLLRAPCSASGG